MQARLTLITIVVVAMAALLALHIAAPCNEVWPDPDNCLIERLRGDTSGYSEPEQVEEAESAPSPDPDPVPQGRASGDGVVSCGSGGCFQDGRPVYPIQAGDACVSDGVLGTWREDTQQVAGFRCEH